MFFPLSIMAFNSAKEKGEDTTEAVKLAVHTIRSIRIKARGAAPRGLRPGGLRPPAPPTYTPS